MPLISINPANGQENHRFEEHTEAEVEAKLVLAQNTFESWKETDFEHRAKLMMSLNDVLLKNKEKYAKAMTLEMGKLFKSAVAEVEKCALVCRYYAENAEAILSEEVIPTEASESYVRFDPIGIVLAVMPWNYPFWQVMRFAAPAAMAGNIGLLKHASNVPQSAEFLEEAFLEAGFPKGVFQNLLIRSSRVEAVVRDPRIKATTLTGSEYAGSQVAMQSSSEIKKSVLELGGSDPFIVLKDADLNLSCEVGGNARLQNSGQSCIAAKRFIVEEAVYDEFLGQFKAYFESQVMGDPMDDSTTFGPLSSEAAVKDIDELVQKSAGMGATILLGGKPVEGPGFFYPPTILTDVKKGMPAYGQEFFGPVAIVIKVKDEDEAIHVANDTEFGLGASLWTKDLERAKKLIPKIDAGAVFVNSMVKSDPRLPFGGVKKSGFGRELSHYGIKEFVNVKTVVIK